MYNMHPNFRSQFPDLPSPPLLNFWPKIISLEHFKLFYVGISVCFSKLLKKKVVKFEPAWKESDPCIVVIVVPPGFKSSAWCHTRKRNKNGKIPSYEELLNTELTFLRE